MKQLDDGEASIWTILIALTITAITIAIFLFPTPTDDIPQVDLKDVPPKVEAVEVEERNTSIEIPALRKALVPVCSCESIGDPNGNPMQYHYEDDGTTPLIGRYNSSDRGMCQINLDAHGETIEAMGLDILNNKADYITFTNHLYDTQGLKPWKYSQHCWE